MIKILLADDHPLLRKGLKDTIQVEKEFVVIAEAGSGDVALSLIIQNKPDIAVLDIDMPKMSGLEVAEAVAKQKLETKIIILTMYDNENIFNRAIDIGVYGYLLKDNAISEISEAICCVNLGEYYITPSLTKYMVKRYKEKNNFQEKNPSISLLTCTERKILKLISEGKASQLIADELFISLRTVETHRNNMCQKLNTHGPNALLKYSIENKNVL